MTHNQMTVLCADMKMDFQSKTAIVASALLYSGDDVDKLRHVHNCALQNSQLLHHDDVALAAVTSNGMSIASLPPKQRGRYEIICAAVTNSGGALAECLSEWDDLADGEQRAVLLLALASYPQAMLADVRHRNSEAFMHNAVRVCPAALQFAPEALRGHRSLVMRAVQKDGTALQYAADSCRRDPILVDAAVKENSQALEHSGEVDDKFSGRAFEYQTK